VPDQSAEGLSDRALVERAAAGDREAFDLIVVRHRGSVFRLARLLVPQQHEAEDVLQQTFLAAWRSAGQFRGDASLRTWLLTITRHTALRARERRQREPIDDTPLDELGRAAGWGGPDPEAMALASQRRDLLAAAFEALTPEDREVLTLRDLEGLSGEETAALLGVGLAAMKSRLHRARLALAVRVRNEVSRATGRA